MFVQDAWTAQNKQKAQHDTENTTMRRNYNITEVATKTQNHRTQAQPICKKKCTTKIENTTKTQGKYNQDTKKA